MQGKVGRNNGYRIRTWSDDTRYTGSSIVVVLRHYKIPFTVLHPLSFFIFFTLYTIKLLGRFRPGGLDFLAYDTCSRWIWLSARIEQIEPEFFFG